MRLEVDWNRVRCVLLMLIIKIIEKLIKLLLLLFHVFVHLLLPLISHMFLLSCKVGLKLVRLSLAATVYYIWWARNRKIFNSMYQNCDQIVKMIISEIDTMAMNWKGVRKSKENWELSLTWSFDQCIFSWCAVYRILIYWLYSFLWIVLQGLVTLRALDICVYCYINKISFKKK